jgi:hypothetical protein
MLGIEDSEKEVTMVKESQIVRIDAGKFNAYTKNMTAKEVARLMFVIMGLATTGEVHNLHKGFPFVPKPRARNVQHSQTK